MKGVILGTGRGTRLRPLADKPKDFVEVNAEPPLASCLDEPEGWRIEVGSPEGVERTEKTLTED